MIFLLILQSKNVNIMKNDLANIFVGSDIEANYIASILTDNEIRHIIQNTFGESISAGFVKIPRATTSTITVLRTV